ncbi:unnamed protein product, partial [marine sediment metagenome]
DYFATLKEVYDKAGNKIMRRFAKDMLNSLYGKFSQSAAVVEEQYELDCKGYYREQTYDTITGKSETITKMFNKIWVTFGSELCKNSFVAISAHVTEYARFYLYNLMKIVGVNNVLYTDTDSLKIRERDLPKLKRYIHPRKLGKLKIESKFKNFTIYGAKYYQADDEIRIKGIPDNAEKIGEYKYRYTSFLKQATHLRSKITRFYITKSVVKTVEPFYNKGIVQSDGWIKPIEFKAFS